MTGAPVTPVGANFLLPRAGWRAATLAGHFSALGGPPLRQYEAYVPEDAVRFRANWVKILEEEIYWVPDEDKYNHHVSTHTLWLPSALRMNCEMDMKRNHLNHMQDIFVERQRTPFG